MKIKIVCLGDSLTEGYEIDKSKRWSDLLGEEFNAEIINSGISGDTTAGMLSRFHNMVIAHNPTHVIIMGGTNDLSINISDEIILGNILAMTRQARYNEITPIIGIPTPSFGMNEKYRSTMFLDSNVLSDRIALYRRKLIEFAVEDNHEYIDFGKNITSEVLLDDCLHPDEKGHEIMMENAKVIINNLYKNKEKVK